MSTVVEVRLPWGRYQATPWASAVNEGAVEWPPSPWRFLRALYSSWKVHNPELPEHDVHELLSLLAVSPAFVLPHHTVSHTRHYMPGKDHRRSVQTDTAKVLNACVVVDRDARLWIEWPITLNDVQRELLGTLVAGVRYLGRAESIVEVAVVDAAGDGTPCRVVDDDAPYAVRVLSPSVPLDLAALTMTPVEVRAGRQLLPPSTELVRYEQVAAARQAPRRTVRSRNAPTALRFEISSTVMPSKYSALRLGSLAHSAVVRKVNDLANDGLAVGRDFSMLTGKDAAGDKLTGLHDHAHFLPFIDGRKITGLLLWVPAGIEDEHREALRALRHLVSPRFDDSVVRRLVLVAEGDPCQIAPELAASSAVWQSVTPFLMSHRHRGDIETQLAKDVRRQLAFRGLPGLVHLERVDDRWLQFERHRENKETLADRRAAYGLRITLDAPITGPLALGRHSHFGLGLFAPVVP